VIETIYRVEIKYVPPADYPASSGDTIEDINNARYAHCYDRGCQDFTTFRNALVGPSCYVWAKFDDLQMAKEVERKLRDLVLKFGANLVA